MMLSPTSDPRPVGRPQLGFAGLGWIGSNRLRSVAESGCCDVRAYFEPVDENCAEVAKIVPDAVRVDSFDQLLSQPISGVVLATPNALHREQAVRAFENGLAVFCQKPLGRNAAEASAVVAAARRGDRLLGVDHSYRWLNSAQWLRRAYQSGELGNIFAVDLTFHNGYGPDKAWFFDRAASGGGCLIDLGVHLIDLLFWIIGNRGVVEVSSSIYLNGERLQASDLTEDYAVIRILLEDGLTVNLTCSWTSHLGKDAEIKAVFHGTRATAAVENTNGSFFDLTGELRSGTSTKTTAVDSDWTWGGRAIIDWTERLGRGERYDPSCQLYVATSEIIDAIYRQAARVQPTLKTNRSQDANGRTSPQINSRYAMSATLPATS
jgi:predicted dehydrogenase